MRFYRESLYFFCFEINSIIFKIFAKNISSEQILRHQVKKNEHFKSHKYNLNNEIAQFFFSAMKLFANHTKYCEYPWIMFRYAPQFVRSFSLLLCECYALSYSWLIAHRCDPNKWQRING